LPDRVQINRLAAAIVEGAADLQGLFVQLNRALRVTESGVRCAEVSKRVALLRVIADLTRQFQLALVVFNRPQALAGCVIELSQIAQVNGFIISAP
jgi:hypothetical protein